MMKHRWSDWLASVSDFVMPRRCALCNNMLERDEKTVCIECMLNLPRTYCYGPDNEAEMRLRGRADFEHGTAFCYYHHQGMLSQTIARAKYNYEPFLNKQMASLFAAELSASGAGWPFDIEVIVPVPLHWFRFLRRTYNQSEFLARGLSEVWHIPVETRCLIKHRLIRTQVGLSYSSRLSTQSHAFALRHPERLAGKHVLLVDDVMTSGATLEACLDVLGQVPGIRLSFLTLGMVSD